MIVKKMDSKEEEIIELETFLKSRFPSRQRFSIERELRAIPFLPERRHGVQYHFVVSY